MFGVPHHFLLVHFALVLVLMALFYDLRGAYDLGYRFTLGGALSALAAIASGLMLAGGQLSRMTIHAAAALVGGLSIVALAMLRYSQNAREDDPPTSHPSVWLALELLAVACVVVAVFTGHRAVLGYQP